VSILWELSHRKVVIMSEPVRIQCQCKELLNITCSTTESDVVACYCGQRYRVSPDDVRKLDAA
jgi:hypothetical protein